MTASVGYYVAIGSAIVAIAAVILGALAGLFLHSRFKPRFALRIIPRWDDNKRALLLRLEVENISTVRAGRPIATVQILRYAIPEDGTSLSEWVPFEEAAKRDGEHPLKWEEPIPVFTKTTTPDPSASTSRVYPGEVVAGERLIDCPNDDALHIGLNVRLRARVRVGLHRSGLKVRFRRRPYSHSQTTTRWAVKQATD